MGEDGAAGAAPSGSGAEEPPGPGPGKDPRRRRARGRSRRGHPRTSTPPAARVAPRRGRDVPTGLPRPLSSFVGREHERSVVHRLLDDHRLVTLTGSGGCGKTRLALQVAAERGDRHGAGCWCVELAAAATGSVEHQVAAVLGATGDAERPLRDAVAAHLREGPVLLLVDNCEHLLDEVAPLVDALLASCPELSVLATSRQPLELAGEVTWRVPSMSVPDAAASTVAALDGADAVRLFVDRARRSHPDADLDDADVAAVVEICRRLDGIPLAIELAAARARQVGLADVVRGLDDRFRLLTGGSRTALPRQQTLAASVDWSYDLLGEDERTAFRLLSVFAGSFTLDAAAVVLDGSTAGGGLDGAGVVPTVGGLVDRSLVQREGGTSDTRYRMLETMKAHARARSRAVAGEPERARRRHLAFHIALAEEAGPEIEAREDAGWLAVLDRSHDDLRAALHGATEDGDTAAVLRLAAALAPFWHARGHSDEGQRWYAVALEGASAAPGLAAQVAWASAYLAIYAGDFPLAAARSEDALARAQATDQPAIVARALDSLGTLQQYGDPVGAVSVLERALGAARAAGDRWCEIDCLQKLGYSDYYRDRWPEAVAFGDEARTLLDEMGNPFFRGWADVLDGTAAQRAGDLDGALALHARAFASAEEIGEPLSLLVSGCMLVLRALAAGDAGAAAAALAATEEALGDQVRTGYYAAATGAMHGALALRAGDADTAAAILRDVCDGLRAEGVAFPTSDFLALQAEAHLAAGDVTAGRVVADQLQELDERLRSRRSGPMVALLRGRADLLDGRPDLAEAHARAALVAWVETGFPVEATDALELLAAAATALGHADDGCRLFAAAATAREVGGWTGRAAPQHDDAVAAAVVAARRGVGERAEELWVQGARLELAAAAELASRARGRRGRPPSGWASLTPTEVQVARRVAAGLTNPEIADELVMSRATVKTHVSHILAKLGLRARGQVAAVQSRHEPDPGPDG